MRRSAQRRRRCETIFEEMAELEEVIEACLPTTDSNRTGTQQPSSISSQLLSMPSEPLAPGLLTMSESSQSSPFDVQY